MPQVTIDTKIKKKPNTNSKKAIENARKGKTNKAKSLAALFSDLSK